MSSHSATTGRFNLFRYFRQDRKAFFILMKCINKLRFIWLQWNSEKKKKKKKWFFIVINRWKENFPSTTRKLWNLFHSPLHSNNQTWASFLLSGFCCVRKSEDCVIKYKQTYIRFPQWCLSICFQKTETLLESFLLAYWSFMASSSKMETTGEDDEEEVCLYCCSLLYSYHLFLKLSLQLPCFFIHLQMLSQILLTVVLVGLFFSSNWFRSHHLHLRKKSVCKRKKK